MNAAKKATLYKKAALCVSIAALSGTAFGGEFPTIESMQGMQFNFSTPGARSLGMGGAFLGRADDATSAFTNPAGLTNLFSTEISAEYRKNDFSTRYSSSGTYPSINDAQADSDVSNLSFLSFVKPFENWVFAFYYHQLMDFETDFRTDAITFPDFFDTFPTDNMIDVAISNIGFSSALRVSENISIGASVSYYDFDLDASTRRFNNSSSTTANNAQFATGDDNDVGFTLGAQFTLTEQLKMGLVYRSSPTFDATNRSEFPVGTIDFERTWDFQVPDVWGVGFSFQPNDNLTVNFDINRVSYSDLVDPAFWSLGADATLEQAQATSRLSVDDGTQFHLGLEYVLSEKPIALRVGAWHDPAHAIDYAGPADTFTDQVWDAFFRGSDDEMHYSVGAGFFFTNVQIDIAADFSEIQDTISISGVYRFD